VYNMDKLNEPALLAQVIVERRDDLCEPPPRIVGLSADVRGYDWHRRQRNAANDATRFAQAAGSPDTDKFCHCSDCRSPPDFFGEYQIRKALGSARLELPGSDECINKTTGLTCE